MTSVSLQQLVIDLGVVSLCAKGCIQQKSKILDHLLNKSEWLEKTSLKKSEFTERFKKKAISPGSQTIQLNFSEVFLGRRHFQSTYFSIRQPKFRIVGNLAERKLTRSASRISWLSAFPGRGGRLGEIGEEGGGGNFPVWHQIRDEFLQIFSKETHSLELFWLKAKPDKNTVKESCGHTNKNSTVRVHWSLVRSIIPIYRERLYGVKIIKIWAIETLTFGHL